MGKYFNPVSSLHTVGRQLNGSFSFKGLVDQLKEGEYLIGFYRTITGVILCPHLQTAEVFNYHETNSIDSSYWAISRNDYTKFVA